MSAPVLSETGKFPREARVRHRWEFQRNPPRRRPGSDATFHDRRSKDPRRRRCTLRMRRQPEGRVRCRPESDPPPPERDVPAMSILLAAGRSGVHSETRGRGAREGAPRRPGRRARRTDGRGRATCLGSAPPPRTPETEEVTDRPRHIGIGARILVLLVRAYQILLSPLFHLGGGGCRFHPTCSAYAIAVIQKDGALKGTVRAIGRLLRCHPLHPGGFDPP